jgi:hypothetical protein
MNPDIRVQLTRDLEKIKLTAVGANTPWLFVLGIVGEVIGGTAFFAFSIRLTIQAVSENRHIWLPYLVLFGGIVLIGHSGYLVIKRSLNRKLCSLYQAILESDERQAV